MIFFLTYQEWPGCDVGGITLRKIGDTEILQEHSSALLAVLFSGYLKVHHLYVVLLLPGNGLVDEEKVQADCGSRSTDTKWYADVKR